MRYRWLALAMTLGAGIVSSTAHAVSNADYLATRNKTAVVALSSSANISSQIPGHAGQTTEFEGTISGVFSGNGTSGYLLRIDPSQTLIFSDPNNDQDIAVGSTMRVLARIPVQGTVFESVSATALGPTLALSDLSTLRNSDDDNAAGFDPIPMAQQQQTQYYQVPELTPQARPSTPAQNSAVASNLPLAQQEYVVNLYANRIQQFNSDINQDLAHKIAFNLLDISEKNDVDPRLSFALISQESRFNPRAVSPVGALGLGQLMPGTASSLGVNDPFDVTDNLNGTIRYLSSMLKRYGHLSLALAAYNAGPGNVSKYGGVPPFRETQNYVKVIWKRYARLAGLDPISGQQIAVQ